MPGLIAETPQDPCPESKLLPSLGHRRVSDKTEEPKVQPAQFIPGLINLSGEKMGR